LGLKIITRREKDSSCSSVFSTGWRRSLLEIARQVELEAGRRGLEHLVGLFGHLREMGLVELR